MNLLRLKLALFALTPALMLTKADVSAKETPVDMVFTLDLSGSTNGLIDDVRDKIWDLNNEMARFYPASKVRFAVVGYSRPSFGDKNQFVKVLCPLTSDIDFLAGELYKLKPNIEKGDQFVGAAIRASVELINWSNEKNAVKEIFLTGNGSVNLGAFDVKTSCEMAKQKGITIHSFYCYSSLRYKDIGGWNNIAELTGGKSVDIKVHKRLPSFQTVSDLNKLRSLAQELNKTYIYFGKNGQDRYKTMLSNEKNTLQAGQASFEALMYHKISDRYQGKQSEWDLVDFIKSRNGNLKNIDSATLPDSLRKINPEQLLTRVMQLKEKRNMLISQLRQLLPYDRQDKLNAFYQSKSDEQGMIFDRQVMLVLQSRLQENELAVN
jgi:hypothetical protein